MDRTATQQAGIAAEAIDSLNQRIRATIRGEDGADLKRVKDAYETACSLKLMAQRLTLTADELSQVVGEWNEEGHLRTGHDVDVDASVVEFKAAMTEAHKAAQALFTALHAGTKSLGPMGWQEPSRATA